MTTQKPQASRPVENSSEKVQKQTRKPAEEKVSKQLTVYFTQAEVDAIGARSKAFGVSRSAVVRDAACGRDPSIMKDVDPHGGIVRVMSLADKQDYKTFKQVAATLNQFAKRLNTLANLIDQADDLEGSIVRQVKFVAESGLSEAQELTRLARQIVTKISRGPLG